MSLGWSPATESEGHSRSERSERTRGRKRRDSSRKAPTAAGERFEREVAKRAQFYQRWYLGYSRKEGGAVGDRADHSRREEEEEGRRSTDVAEGTTVQ